MLKPQRARKEGMRILSAAPFQCLIVSYCEYKARRRHVICTGQRRFPIETAPIAEQFDMRS